jgi:hypothetical protein
VLESPVRIASGFFDFRLRRLRKQLLLTWGADMAQGKPTKTDEAADLARRISEALIRERIVPRFVDSYVVENGRQALQVHAAMYRDLLALLQREALLASSVRALEIVSNEPRPRGRLRPRPMARREATLLRKKFLASLVRQQGWNAGDALDFQRDMQMYEELLARAASSKRIRKPFEVADHPFVDRCAFLLDSSFLEKARQAASKALTSLEELATQIVSPQGAEGKGRLPG